jgi:hypothetical protein
MNYKVYLNKYHVYPNGSVYSLIYKRILKPAATGNHGYHVLNLAGKKVYVHRLVTELFLTNPNGLKCINHKNGIKTDNRVENLEYCSHRDNLNHSYQTGLRKTKLTAEDVIRIRTTERFISQRTLAKKYGCSDVNINHIKTRKTWNHI